MNRKMKHSYGQYAIEKTRKERDRKSYLIDEYNEINFKVVFCRSARPCNRNGTIARLLKWEIEQLFQQ